MSANARQRVKRELIRYGMQTEPGLSAEEVELYAMAAIDEVSLACLLVQVANAHYDDPLREAPHTPRDFANYRRYIRVVSVTYQNPWEWVFEVFGSASAVAAAIQTIYHLRAARRKIDAETALLRAQAEKIRAETPKPGAGLEEDEIKRRLSSLEPAQKQIDTASMLMSWERQDRRTREFFAEIVLAGENEYRLKDLGDGIQILRQLLESSIDDALEQLTGPVGPDDFEVRQKLAELIADHTRLIASIRRLDDVELSVEVLNEDDQE